MSASFVYSSVHFRNEVAIDIVVSLLAEAIPELVEL